MDIGERIRKCRENLDMTQEELALKLGYKSRSSVNKVENSRELFINCDQQIEFRKLRKCL